MSRQRQQAYAGLHRRQPERDREEQRHHEEQTHLQQELEEERDEPAPQLGDPATSRGREARPRRGRCGAAPTSRTAPRTHRAASEQPDHRREAEPHRRAVLRLDDAPAAGLEDAEHDEAEADARQRGADEVEACASGSGGVSAMRRVRQRITKTITHLAREHEPPRQVGGEQAADERACGDRDRAGGRDQARTRAVVRTARSSRRPARRSPA